LMNSQTIWRILFSAQKFYWSLGISIFTWMIRLTQTRWSLMKCLKHLALSSMLVLQLIRRTMHILDLLVSTRSSTDINILSIESTLYLCDHCFVECKLSIRRPMHPKKEIS
jgi:hypothetical protein